jgi:hypothetical protein
MNSTEIDLIRFDNVLNELKFYELKNEDSETTDLWFSGLTTEQKHLFNEALPIQFINELTDESCVSVKDFLKQRLSEMDKDATS